MTRKEIAEGLSVINYQYKYGDHRFSDEEREIVSAAISELQSDVVYLCDRKACSDCPGEPCHHTVDITHTVNFEYVGDGTKYMEKELVMNTKMEEIKMSKLMEEIKSCPFCGSEAKYLEYQKMDGNISYTVGMVCCDSCGCGCRTRDVIIDGYYGATTTKEDVIKLWNRRVNHV